MLIAAGVVLIVLASNTLAADPLEGFDPEPLRAAIGDLIATFGDRYPQGPQYLERLNRIAGAGEGATEERAKSIEEFELLRREALTANPLVSGQPILYVVRPQYVPDHHNTATMFQTGEINTGSFRGGGALKTIDFGRGGAVATLIEVPEGIVRDPDVSFDGKRVVLAMREDREDDYHIYEWAAGGSAPRQITFGSGLTDIDPIYLPDGRILFTSTREPKFCMCNRHIMGNLYTIDADGSSLEQIGHSTLHEGHASLLPDGRVIYDRWEYVDRNFGDAQGVWVTNPDGTNHAVYWGNNTNSPGAVLDARAIPGTERFIATFSSCHDRPWGAIAIVDRRLGLDGRGPVIRTWPPEAIERVGKGNYDSYVSLSPKYEDPYPLSNKYFLCSRMTGRGEEMGIFLIDVFGNEILLHAEAPGCFDPMPLAPRTPPPVVPSRVDHVQRDGVFYVENVYTGTGMERIEPGTVKYLRVVESPEKRFWTGPAWDGGTGQQAPGMAWDDFNNKRILGTVPVEADGSVQFAVPADTFVYFQLLDEAGRMIQSMRSGTIVRPGERVGCVGCHENRRSTPVLRYTGAAWSQPVRELEPWYGPARLFSYVAEVQTVFDRHCVSCHDFGKPAGEKLNLAGDLGLVFNTSYTELRGKGYVHVVGAGPYETQMPKTWGSHASRLATIMLDGHGQPEIDGEVRLDRESIDRVITWIDINAPYYPDYAAGAFGDNPFGRSPLKAEEVQRLGELTGIKLLDRGQLTQISFTRPEASPCLAALRGSDPQRYEEALAIVETGGQRLAAAPRPDMPGFRLVSPTELEREKRYEARREELARVREAGKDIVFHGIKANRVLFLGNSITLHGPKADIGWEGNWGMAASSQDRDYVHLVLRAIDETAGKRPESLVANIADFERGFDRYDVESRLAKELAFKPDLVIVAIGENVPALTTEQAKDGFQSQTAKLLKRLKGDGGPVIVVRSCFWPDAAKDAALRQACAEVGGIFVDIGALGREEANFARSERDFTHAGVAGHPGDRGMQAIADAILAAMKAGK